MIQIAGVYVITDEGLIPDRTHVEIAKAAIEGGAKIVQLRDKSSCDKDFYLAALRIREMTRQAGALFFINDRVHIAAAVGADGVNVGQTDMPVAAVRAVLGEKAIIGVSATDLDQARRAEADGADYVGFGPVFATSTKADAGPESGLEMLRRVCEMVRIPVVAIGGIDLANMASVAAAGTASAAVVSAVVCADDMAKATAELIEAFGGRK